MLNKVPEEMEKQILRHTFQKMALNKKSAKVKIPESIRGEKGVEENLPFTHDSLQIKNENKIRRFWSINL